mgnify:CR=1 FL=1
MQNEIATAVADQMKVKLLGQSARPEAAGSSENPAAHNAVLQSDFYFQQQTADSVRKSISFLQEAVRLDPNYALAYAKLSQAWRQYAASFAIDDASKAYDEARQAADKAVSLAPDLPEVRMTVGLLAMNPGLDFAGGEKEFRRVLQSFPNNAAAKNGLCLSLLAQGRFTEAEEACQQALLLDPLLTNLWFNFGRITVGTGRYKEAEEAFRKGLELQPNASRFHTYVATLDILQNRPAQAMTNAELENEGFWRDYAVALVQQAQGDRSAADAALKNFIAKDSISGAFQVAVLYAIRKEPDQMFQWLDIAYDKRDSGLTQLAVTPFSFLTATTRALSPCARNWASNGRPLGNDERETFFLRRDEAAQCLQSGDCLRGRRLAFGSGCDPSFSVSRNSELGHSVSDSASRDWVSIALVIAWAFESTPEGIKRTAVADAAREYSRGKAWICVQSSSARFCRSVCFSSGAIPLEMQRLDTMPVRLGPRRLQQCRKNRSRCCHCLTKAAIRQTNISPTDCRKN